MPQQHTTIDQVNFLGQWFISWSEMQREDFLPILVQAYQPKDHINGLLGGIESLSLQGRRPSLFDCQVKLFHDWFVSWADGERGRLVQHLREVDTDFMAQFDKQVSGIESAREEATATQPECVEENLNNPPSSVSSPPSTLPRSHSPHDSGLDEPASDGDHTEPHSLDSSHDTEDVAAVVADGNIPTGDPSTLPLAKSAKPIIVTSTESQEDSSLKSESLGNGSPEAEIVAVSEERDGSLPAEDTVAEQ